MLDRKAYASIHDGDSRLVIQSLSVLGNTNFDLVQTVPTAPSCSSDKAKSDESKRSAVSIDDLTEVQDGLFISLPIFSEF